MRCWTACFIALILQTHGAFAAGLAGNGLRFDGLQQTVRVAGSPTLDLGDSFTLEAWVYPEALSNPFPRVISRELNINSRYTLALQTSTGSFNSAINGDEVISPTSLTLNMWNHLPVTYDGATARLYLNGQPAGSESFATAVGALGAAEFVLGNREVDGRQFLGIMDEVRVWDVTRSPADVAFWHNRLIPLAMPGLVSYWDFNSGAGTVLFDQIGSNDGVVAGPSWVDSTAPLIPEPSSVVLVAIGATLTLAWAARRQRFALRALTILAQLGSGQERIGPQSLDPSGSQLL